MYSTWCTLHTDQQTTDIHHMMHFTHRLSNGTTHPEGLAYGVGVGVGDAFVAALAATHRQHEGEGAGHDGGTAVCAHQPGPHQLVVLHVHHVEEEELGPRAYRLHRHTQLVHRPSRQDEGLPRGQRHLVRVGGETAHHTRGLRPPERPAKHSDYMRVGGETAPCVCGLCPRRGQQRPATT